MPTSTSLNLQALLKTAAARTGMDESASRVRGLSSAAQAMYVAVQASHRRNALCFVLVPTDEDVERFAGDVRFFIGALEGASAPALEDIVKPFPSLQIDPYRKLAPHFHIASARAAALHGLATGTARVVVASGEALLPKLSHPDRLRSTSLELKPGMDLGPIEFGDLLADAGFTREDPVDEHGEFCVRGGIVDWFPAGAANPIRVEFVGDTIESIRRYDPATQRSIGTLDQATVVPLREAFDEGPAKAGRHRTDSDDEGPAKAGRHQLDSDLEGGVRLQPDPDRATFFDYLGGRDLTLIVSEADEVVAQVRKLEDQLALS